MLVRCNTDTYQSGVGHFLAGEMVNWPDDKPLPPWFDKVDASAPPTMTAEEIAALKAMVSDQSDGGEADGLDVVALRARPGYVACSKKTRMQLATELAGMGVDADPEAPKNVLIKLLLDRREEMED